MLLRMTKKGYLYTVAPTGDYVNKFCFRNPERSCGINCTHFGEARDDNGNIDAVHFKCMPSPSPLFPVEVDK